MVTAQATPTTQPAAPSPRSRQDRKQQHLAISPIAGLLDWLARASEVVSSRD